MSLLNRLLPLIWIIFPLGVYSITRLVVRDTILDRARAWVWTRFPAQGTVHEAGDRPRRGSFQTIAGGRYLVTQGTFLGHLIGCFGCVAFHVSLWAAVCLWLMPSVAVFGLSVFAARSVATLLTADGWVDR